MIWQYQMHRKEAKKGFDRKMPLRGIILEDFTKILPQQL